MRPIKPPVGCPHDARVLLFEPFSIRVHYSVVKCIDKFKRNVLRYRRNEMKAKAAVPCKLPVVLGKLLLRWIFTKADLVFFVYRLVVLLSPV